MTAAPSSVRAARQRARRVLPRPVYDYVEGGAEDEITVEANRVAFEGLSLRPRMAVDAGRPSTRTTVAGQEISLPVLLAPCGFARLVHPDGEIGAARAAASARSISVVSTFAGTRLEDVAAAAGGSHLWFQLYPLGGRAAADQLVDRAATAGYRGLVVTVDTPAYGNRERDVRNRVRQPLTLDLATALTHGPSALRRPRWLYRFVRDGMPVDLPNAPHPARDGGGASQVEALALMAAEPVTWDDLTRLRRRWSGPFVVKGVLTADDARRCVAVGADAVIVSNHGGRQLDGVPSSLEALSEVVDAVAGETDVLVDGGVERGTDVVRALALGARAVLVGRAYLWALACGGEAAVVALLKGLRTELLRDLRLLGCSDVAALDESWLW